MNLVKSIIAIILLAGFFICAWSAESLVFAATYFIAPAGSGGSDSNAGTSSGSPWLTPNHALNCGDLINAAAGTYDEANFRPGQWGVVTCAANNDVAWLKCSTFDTCKINIGTAGHDAMTPTQSYWGIQGWEVTANSQPSTNQCFEAYPPDNVHTIHHIIFANNIANGCGDGGITTGSSTTTVGVDYVAILGNAVYNAAQDNANCYSGIDIVTPINSDANGGTHIYIAGNYSWGNVDPSTCAGHASTDGHGISIDTVNGAGTSYSGQIVIDNNISVFNGGTGIQSFQNIGPPTSTIIARRNTTYGNQTGAINANPCAEITVNFSGTTSVYNNLAQTAAATACLGAVTLYVLARTGADATAQLTNNFIYSAAGNNTVGPGSSFSGNLTGTSPAFANPVEPSAPSCGSFSSVPACMATMIANYVPATTAAKPYGYQAPGANVFDPLYPQWLCSVTNMPAGLVTPGCSTAGSTSYYFVRGGGTPNACPSAPALSSPQNPIDYGADPTGVSDSSGAFDSARAAGDIDVHAGTYNLQAGFDLGTRNMRCESGAILLQPNYVAQTVMVAMGLNSSVYNCDFRGPYYNTQPHFNDNYSDFLHVNRAPVTIVDNSFNGTPGFTGAIDVCDQTCTSTSVTLGSGSVVCGNTFKDCAYYAIQLIESKNLLFEFNTLQDCAGIAEANLGGINTGNVSKGNHVSFVFGVGWSNFGSGSFGPDSQASYYGCGTSANGNGFDYSGNTCENDVVQGPHTPNYLWQQCDAVLAPFCPTGAAKGSWNPTFINETCTNGCTFVPGP